ncbi:uncharacterized protein CEXT_301061 [Caerostris extrusa]|uniref:Uncharacterized protein n=1 Tax=Caerostris extrusa TaxID=172846 RepID=A0AAV4MRG9_CAEEX|nr:uncharacterized protein CEXT_301061 [Caerostris extrusa]
MQLESLVQKTEPQCLTAILDNPESRCSSNTSWIDERFMESRFKNVNFWRTKARLLFRILLATGFLVQSWMLVDMYMQHPSAVDLEVVQPSEVDLPAFTVCNINEIRSTAYCEEYSDNCGSPENDPEFCVNFHEYCHLVNNSKQVTKFKDVSNIDIFPDMNSSGWGISMRLLCPSAPLRLTI